jgi:DNA-binding LacI/PurR family transcriptional regulator
MSATREDGGSRRVRRRSNSDGSPESNGTHDGSGRRRQADGRNVSIRDVAAQAGVSVATVSRVLSSTSDYPVRPETRQGVLRAAARIGYRPNDLARALIQGRTGTVGVLIPDISNPYYAEVVHGVEDVISASGRRVVLCNTNRDVEKASRYVDTLLKARVDGIVIVGGGSTRLASFLRPLEVYGTRVVVIGRHDLPFPSIQVDNVEAARQATEYLLGLGHTAVGFITGPADSYTVQDRLAGYMAALKAHGLSVRRRLIVEADFEEAGGYAGARQLLTARGRPTAVLAANDRGALGVLAALADAGISVPVEMSVMGFDDIALASFVRPALTTVAIPSSQLGREAAFFLNQDEPAPAAESRELATRLVIRDSCCPP